MLILLLINMSYKFDNIKLSQLVLLRIYILRYIRHLKHITWMPGSIAVNKLVEQYDGKKTGG